MSEPFKAATQSIANGSRISGVVADENPERHVTEGRVDRRHPLPFKLTIVVPVFNEERTIRRVLDSLVAQPLPGEVEIIVVDDGSTDRTQEILQATWHTRHVGVRHEVNRGKGAAVRSGIALASGTHLLVFDADSEYDPADIPSLIAPILGGRAEVVYGVRVRGGGTFPSLLNVIGNRVMTAAANALYGSAITDLHTCLKLVPVPMLRRMRLEEEGFGLDTEISAELLRLGFRPYEVPVTYVGRSREEGKKIRLVDAYHCFEVLLRVRLRGRKPYGLRDRRYAPRVTADTQRSSSEGLAAVADVQTAVNQ
jgi:glycosyltransferase involved in cell wall biosynthesis